jgi:hypothetical protein
MTPRGSKTPMGSGMVTDAEIEAAVGRMRRADYQGWATFNAGMIADRERMLALAARLAGQIRCSWPIHTKERPVLGERCGRCPGCKAFDDWEMCRKEAGCGD